MVAKTFGKTDQGSAFGGFKMPRVDFESVMNSHKKNMEAFSKAQRSAFDTVKTLTQAHQAYLKETFGDMRAHLKEVTQAKTLEEKVEAQTKQVKNSFEKAMNHGKNMASVCQKAQKEHEALWHGRLTEGTAEAKEMARKAQEAMKKH
ncbi:MAG: phasin family protein [Alphaproteobacteria bacterium]|jgi:phasin family protein|nr:phasin family protein [Alphaproteobacteria bacterium]